MDTTQLTVIAPRRSRIRRMLDTLFDVLDDWAFTKLDAQATAQGWQVRRPAPFIRVYRNPRFDTLSACRSCAGEGVTAKGVCLTCFGTGRVRAS